MHLRIWNLILGTLLSCSQLLAQDRDQLFEEIQSIIQFETNVDPAEIPGFMIGVIDKDSIFQYHFGVSEVGSKNTLSDSSLFELGALTHVFTATLAERLESKGLIDIGKPLSEYSSIKIDKELSIQHLLSHTSGLPYRPEGFGLKELDASQPFAYYGKEDLLEYLQSLNPGDLQPGSYLFSNVNYAILELLLEEVLEKDFPSIFHEYLSRDLGLKETAFLIPSRQISPGYNLSGQITRPWLYSSYLASLGAKSSLRDLLHFVRSQWSNKGWAKVFEETHKAIYPTNISKNTKVGEGWHVVEVKRFHPILALNGATEGHSAFIGMVPGSQTGVVILANTPRSMEGLGMLILRMINNNWRKRRN